MSSLIQALLLDIWFAHYAVVIQQKKQRPSGFWKLVNDDNDTPQYEVPITSLNAAKETKTTATAFTLPEVPTVRTTLPREDFNERKNDIPRSSKSTKPITTSVTVEKRQRPCDDTQTKQSRQHTHEIFASSLKARKFHLVRNPSPMSSPFLVPKTIAQKHRDKRKKDLAMFAEKPEIIRKVQFPGNVLSHSSGEPRHVDDGEKKDTSQLCQPRKRPNATAAERKWRTETWTNPPKPNENLTRTAENINEPSSQWNYESTRLVEQLQEIALEEIRASEQQVKGLSGSGQLKIKPKPPKPRQPRAEKSTFGGSGHNTMTNAIDLADEGDYVLDTYVRSSARPFEVTEPADSRYDSLHGTDHGKIGILVIEDEEEEALWEAFAEDEESDAEWKSEEEDENG